jgi:hypothetical protein
MRNVHGWLGQHAHALIMKRAMGDVTLGLWGHSKQPATKIGRQILHALAEDQSQASTEGKQIRTRIDLPRQLPSPAADGFNNLADCIDHQLRLFLVYFVAAIRFGDVFSIRNKFREAFLRFLLCGIGDIAEVRRDVG